MKAMKNQKGFCSNTNSMTCTAERIIIPAFIFAFNIIITLFQEIFCYQIHQNKFAYGIKNNLHNFVKFSHKFLVIILFCIFEDSAKIIIVFSVFFNVCDLLVLHYRLPYFNLAMLRFSRDDFEEETLLKSPKPNHLDSILSPLSPANQRLLSNSYQENDLATAFKSFRSEVP